jgi:uncharacterized protein (DUF1684 family)
MNEAAELWNWRTEIANLYHDVRLMRHAPEAWHLWCATRTTLFRDHPQSPIERGHRGTFQGPVVFPYDPALRFEVRLATAAPDRLSVATGTDGTTMMHAFARTIGLQDPLGGELTLYWIEGYGGGVFLPFADATNGQETYGGGRYLLDTIKGADLGAVRADGSLPLDFNFAYFPSCAYSSRWVCPLTPAGNRLPGALRCGERLALAR